MHACLIVGQLTGIVCGCAESLCGNDGIGSRTTAHAFRAKFFEKRRECIDTPFVNQGHMPLGDSVAPQEVIVDDVFHIDQRIAKSVNVVHRIHLYIELLALAQCSECSICGG